MPPRPKGITDWSLIERSARALFPSVREDRRRRRIADILGLERTTMPKWAREKYLPGWFLFALTGVIVSRGDRRRAEAIIDSFCIEHAAAELPLSYTPTHKGGAHGA